jgi:hypothetical protein
MLRLFLLAVLASILGCADTLDGVGHVHDLRLLGMKAEPPELFLGDMRPVTVTALVANPAGGLPISCKWTTCAQQDSATSRCLESSPGFAMLGESIETATADGAEPSVMFTPDLALLTMVAQADPYRGLGGIRQVVQIEVQAGAENVVGFKRVVFQPPSKVPVTLNVNPIVGPVEFNDAGWGPTDTVRFSVAPPRMMGVMMGSSVKNQLAILEDRSLPEDYVVRTFEGETRVLHETWRYNYFATHGSFSPTQGGGNNLLFADAGIETTWAPVGTEDGGSGPTTVWIVVRDGRGGENWVARHAEAP